jgi:putative peptidoglycan lipid II flippase
VSSKRLKAIAGVTAIVLISKMLGLGREMVIADRFGTTSDYDLYLIAVMLPALAWGVINFAVYYLFVPQLTRTFEVMNSTDDQRRWQAVWSRFNVTVLASLGVMALLFVSAPLLMRIWASGYLEDDFARILFYSRATAAMVLLGSIEAFLRAALNVRKIFSYPAAGMIIFNIGVIAGTILFEPKYGVGSVAIGFLGGFVLQNLFLLMRLIPLKAFSGYSLSLPDESLRPLMQIAGLLVIIELLNRSYFLIDRFFAPAFGEGIISALNYGQVLVQLPDAVVGFSIASVVYPLFSESSGQIDRRQFGSVYQEAITGGMLVAVPMAIFFFVNAVDLVYLIFFRGVFDSTSVEMTARVLQPYTPTIIALFIVSTSIRACYAQGWTKQVMWFTAVLIALKFAATMWLSRWIGYPGISAASSLSQVIYAALLLGLIVRRIDAVDRQVLLGRLWRIILAGAICLIVAYLFNNYLLTAIKGGTRPMALARLAVSGLFLVCCYTLSASMLGFRHYLFRWMKRSSGV